MNIVIIDDDALVTTALKTILEADPHVTVTGTGSDGREVLPLYRSLRPDVLLMDIRMEGMSGLEASKAVLAEDPGARILLLTTFSDDEYIVQALRCGVKGYLLKADYSSILPALRAVQTGQTVFGTEISVPHPGASSGGESFSTVRRTVSPTGSISSSVWWRKGSATVRLPPACSWGRGPCAIT